MSDKNYGLELYKLIMEKDEYDYSPVSEFGWISDKEFCVWVDYSELGVFMTRIRDIFGIRIYDDGGFEARMQDVCACFDLCKALHFSVEEIEQIFPKDKYRH